MGIIGFSFSKFDCKRNAVKVEGNIEINHNISVKDVTKTSLKVAGRKNDVLRIDFSFDVIYGNSLGKISLEGDVVYSDTPEIITETFKSWEADKKLSQMVNEQVFKFVYGKASIKALTLSDSLNLPSPIPLPRVNFGTEKKK
ncbi:MAG: hypothetical protein KC589_10120 [Nanoarchaeota archaeon]|nr:hypothetical protein [Nanoarchaeota archaeon]